MSTYVSYIITTILGAVLGALIAFCTKYFRNAKAERQAVLALLRDAIVNTYYTYVDEKEIPYFKKESIVMVYEIYASLGGNHFAKDLINEIRDWKVTK